MANWLQSRLKAAEDLLEAVDRTAKTVSVPRWDQQDAPKSVGGRKNIEQDAPSQMESRSSPTDAEAPHTGAEPSSAEPAEKLQHEHDAVTADDSSVLGQDNLSVPSSSTLAERPVGAAETVPRPAAVLPQIPFALSSAQVPFESATSTVMLQMPSRGTGTIKWDSPRLGTPEPSDVEGAAVCLTDDAGQFSPSSMAPVPAPLPAPIAKAKPGQHPSDHSYETTLELKDDLESAPESADQMTAEPIPRPSKAEAQAAAIAEAISAAAAAAGPAWEAAPDSSDAQLQGAPQNEREVRLGRVVEQLRRRLDQLREENEQLEEELRSTDSKLAGTAERVERLEDELARAQVARVSAEASLNSAVAAQHLAEQQLEREREANATRLAQAEAVASNLAEENARLQTESQASQEDMVAALRAEAAAAEQRLEEERAAHAEACRSFVAREAELEAGLAESAAALSGMQRSLDDRARRCAAAEQRALSAEQRADALARDLASHQAELTARGDTPGNQGHSAQSQAAELEALSKAVAGQRAALQEATAQQQAAEDRARRLQQEVERLSSELQEAGPASDLQRQFREVTELLFQKQTQLERLAAEKAAQQLSLERELDAAREQAERVNRRARSDRSAGYIAEGDVVVPMEAMGEAYYRLANNNRVGGAVKAGAAILDTTASTVVRVLKQYPLGRLAAFAYAIFIHVFIWILINRLQHRALSTDHLLAANTTRGSLHP